MAHNGDIHFKYYNKNLGIIFALTLQWKQNIKGNSASINNLYNIT